MNLEFQKVDTKKGLRIVWVVEGALLFVMTFVVILFVKDKSRVTDLVNVMPYLFGLIALQATGAIGGSNLKRWTESLVIRAKNGRKEDDCQGAAEEGPEVGAGPDS